jgi:hypothetical protein
VASPLIPDKMFIFFSLPRAWSDARSYCVGKGAVLATIASDTEQAAVIAAVPMGRYWIGINDITNEGTFVWADGSSATYRNFGSGNPSDTGGSEDCGEIINLVQNFDYYGGWNDNSCTTQQGFLCATCSNGPCTLVFAIYILIHPK